MVVCMEVVLILLIDVGGLSLKVGSLSLDPALYKRREIKWNVKYDCPHSVSA